MEQTKKSKENSSGTEYMTLPEWKKKHNTSDAVYRGACTMNGWYLGKQVTEKEYQTAVSAFLKGSVGGQKC